MRRGKRCKNCLTGGLFAVAFAVGILATIILPPVCLVVILVMSLLLLGITCYKK
ncbi:MAG: hypothetical protein IIU66_06150 [Clostridia bacterium]|nr:hypothetical protein [Clostridia bacterium]